MMRLVKARHGEQAIILFGAAMSIVGPLILYWDTFTGQFGFVQYDLLVMGRWGSRPLLSALGSFFRCDEFHYYRPLHEIYAWVSTQMGGPARWAQGGLGYLLHLAAVLAFYGAARRLTGSRMVGVLTSMLWSLSTVHLHAFLSPAALASERLWAISAGLSLWLFFSRGWRFTPLALGLGLLSKESAVMVPAVLTAAWLFLLARAWKCTARLPRHWLQRGCAVGVCWLIAVVYVVLQMRHGALIKGGALTPDGDIILFMPRNLLFPGDWRSVLTWFASDIETALLRSFEFLLWPVLPGHAYPTEALRSGYPPQAVALFLGMIIVVLPLDLVSLIRSRKTVVFSPLTYFCIAWFVFSMMPLGLCGGAKMADKPHVAMLPSVAVYCLFGLGLRRLQKDAIRGYAVPFMIVVGVAYCASLLAWYPYAIRQSRWAKERSQITGRLEQICQRIGKLPRGEPTPALVLVGVVPNSRDDAALSAVPSDGYGLMAFYRRPLRFWSVGSRASLWVGPDGRLRQKGSTDSLDVENLRIMEKLGDQYEDVTSSVLRQSGETVPSGTVNIALYAKATASSELKQYDIFRPANVNDDGPGVWAPEPSKKIGAWVQLTWDFPVRIQKVELELRGIGDRVTEGHLVFSDGGTTLSVEARLEQASPISMDVVPPRTITWVRFVIDAGEAGACGLREFRVFGEKATLPDQSVRERP